jgi:Domain of unknown function (DUF4386)
MSMLRGYLIFRSGYFPRLLGALLVLGGFVLKNFVLVLAPRYDSNLFALPMFIAMTPLALWFLVKGLDSTRWKAQPKINI